MADRIQTDIHSRRLRPGDRYLTAKEASVLLGVSQATCDRAMRLLANRNVLSRRRNSGTFVSVGDKVDEKAEDQPSKLVRSIYVLLSPDRGFAGLPQSEMVDSLMSEFPDTGVYFTTLPAGNEVRYVEELLAIAATTGQVVGVIAVSCPREVYGYLSHQNMPVVVLGSVDSANERLASIDPDGQEAGRLLAKHMYKQGYRKFAVLNRELWRPGDNLFLEGVQEVLHTAELPLGALSILSLPHDQQLFNQRFHALLAELKEPLAVVCSDAGFVPWLDEMLSDESDLGGREMGIAYHAGTLVPDNLEAVNCPFVYSKTSAGEISNIIGKMLVQMGSGTELSQRHVFLPVELVSKKTTQG